MGTIAVSAPDSITLKNEISWAVGSTATGAVTNAVAMFALFFLTSHVGLEAGIAGLLIFATKLYDAISDPIMGRITDNWQGGKGRRAPFLCWGALLLGISFFFFFNLSPMSTGIAIPVVLLLLLSLIHI